MAPINLSVLSINKWTYYLIGTSLPVMHIPFPALLFSLDVLHPSTPSANSTPSTKSSHPTQGQYQPFVYLLLCYWGCFVIIPSLQVLIVLPVPTQATQHKEDTLYPSVGVSPFCALQGTLPSWGTPFSHTPTVPRGYSLHRVPRLMWQSSNVCGTSLNEMSYI